MHKASEYVWIERWGRFLGSAGYYIRDEQMRAAKDNAPINAISRKGGPDYKKDYGWSTIEEVTNPDTRHYFKYNYPGVCPKEWDSEAK